MTLPMQAWMGFVQDPPVLSSSKVSNKLLFRVQFRSVRELIHMEPGWKNGGGEQEWWAAIDKYFCLHLQTKGSTYSHHMVKKHRNLFFFQMQTTIWLLLNCHESEELRLSCVGDCSLLEESGTFQDREGSVTSQVTWKDKSESVRWWCILEFPHWSMCSALEALSNLVVSTNCWWQWNILRTSKSRSKKLLQFIHPTDSWVPTINQAGYQALGVHWQTITKISHLVEFTHYREGWK